MGLDPAGEFMEWVFLHSPLAASCMFVGHTASFLEKEEKGLLCQPRVKSVLLDSAHSGADPLPFLVLRLFKPKQDRKEHDG